MATRIQLRRGTSAEWTAADPVLASGEPGADLTTGETRVGDGVARWSQLPPSFATRAGFTTPTTLTAAALQAAADGAAAAGTTLRAAGTLATNATLTLASDCDLGGLTLTYTGTSTAVQVGTGPALRRKRMVLPNVVDASKPATGWRPGLLGVRLTNLADCKVRLSNVQDFERGVLCWGQGTEFAYNEISVAGLGNNKVNLTLDADATGWVNQNLFLSGRYSHNSGEGVRVAGCYHIYLADVASSRPNGNVWVGASIESPNVVQYALNVESGNFNMWLGCRWEDSSGTPRARWGPKAIQNQVVGGYAAVLVAFTRVAGSRTNRVDTADSLTLDGTGNPVVRLENVSGGALGALAIYAPGTLANVYSPTADYCVLASSTALRLKNKTDATDRFAVDWGTKTMSLGAGFAAQASKVMWFAGTPEGVQTAPIGSTYYNYQGTGFGRYSKGSGTGNTGWQATGFQPFTTAGRPTAALAGIGGTYYDTTLGKPGFSDGTVWRDAAGVAI